MENQEKKQPVQLRKSEILAKMNAGHSKDEIRLHYGLNANQWAKALKAMGISNKRTKKIDFVIMPDAAPLTPAESAHVPA